jgi:hypothetical protein
MDPEDLARLVKILEPYGAVMAAARTHPKYEERFGWQSTPEGKAHADAGMKAWNDWEAGVTPGAGKTKKDLLDDVDRLLLRLRDEKKQSDKTMTDINLLYLGGGRGTRDSSPSRSHFLTQR